MIAFGRACPRRGLLALPVVALVPAVTIAGSPCRAPSCDGSSVAGTNRARIRADQTPDTRPSSLPKTGWSSTAEENLRYLHAALPLGEEVYPSYPHPDWSAFSRDSKLLAIPFDDGAARLFDTTKGELYRPAFVGGPRPQPSEFTSASVHLFTFSPDGRSLVWSGREVVVWDLESGEVVFRGHKEKPEGKVAMSPTGRLLAVETKQGVQLWELGAMETHLSLMPGWIGGFSPDGRLLATVVKRQVLLWDVETRAGSGPPLEHDHNVFEVLFSPDGRALVTGTASGFLPPTHNCWHVWNITPRERVLTLPCTEGNWPAAAFSSDSRLLAATDEREPVAVWDVGSRNLVATLGRRVGWGHSLRRRRKLAFSLDREVLADGQFVETKFLKMSWKTDLWDLSQQAPLLVQPLPSPGVSFTPDGLTMVHLDKGGFSLWDVPRRRQVGPVVRTKVAWDWLLLSPDGRLLATTDKHAIYLWDVAKIRSAE